MTFAQCQTIADMRAEAARVLPRMVFDFIDGGAGEEATARWNVEALAQWRLIGRAPINVDCRQTRTTLFGHHVAAPIVIGPTGLAGVVRPGAELDLARAAAAFGVPFVVSTAAAVDLEQVARAGDGTKWFQLYMLRDRSLTLRLLDRVRDLGFDLVQVTVDCAVPGKRYRDARNGFSLPWRWTPAKFISMLKHLRWALAMARHGTPRLAIVANLIGNDGPAATIAAAMGRLLNPAVDWAELAWLRDQWRGKLVVKGLIDPEAAALARRYGMDGIVVSNHGGRQLDGAAASIDMLPEMVAAAGEQLTVLIDGGFRSGTDIAKALALGAHAVQFGRATLYAAAAGGQPGVSRALTILSEEFDAAMALVGATAPERIARDRVRHDSQRFSVR